MQCFGSRTIADHGCAELIRAVNWSAWSAWSADRGSFLGIFQTGHCGPDFALVAAHALGCLYRFLSLHRFGQ